MPDQQLRNNLRRELLARRAAISDQQQAAAGEAVVSQLAKLEKLLHANKVGAYFSVRSELSTAPLLQSLAEQQKQIALPVLHPVCPGHLLFLQATADTNYVNNQFGIPEPELATQAIVPLAELDILFVPLLGFDAKGNRMGMGGGFYDRTLSGWQAGRYPQLLPIGLAHSQQQVDELPTESWDVPLPMIVTPDKIWEF